ncbi:MAG: hypothetical protein V4582_22395 [Pseudomonadota bacterium]
MKTSALLFLLCCGAASAADKAPATPAQAGTYVCKSSSGACPPAPAIPTPPAHAASAAAPIQDGAAQTDAQSDQTWPVPPVPAAPPAPPPPPPPPLPHAVHGLPPPPPPPAMPAPPPPPPKLPAIPAEAHQACANKSDDTPMSWTLGPGRHMTGVCHQGALGMRFVLRTYSE